MTNLIWTLIIAAILAASPCTVMAQASFSGNGNSGFGGPIGNSNLSITDDETTVTVNFTKGGGEFNDIMVMYIDSKAGGYTSTANFTD